MPASRASGCTQFDVLAPARSLYASNLKIRHLLGHILVYAQVLSKFWRDRWIDGRSVSQNAPNLMPFVHVGDMSMSVADALQNNNWTAAVRGAPSLPALVDFFELYEAVRPLSVNENMRNRISWRLSASGVYTAKSVYKVFFLGRETSPGIKELWSSKAPLSLKVHMWFAM